MRIRLLVLLGIALAALAPAGANEHAGRLPAIAPEDPAEPLPVFVPTPDPRFARTTETYRNAARSAGL